MKLMIDISEDLYNNMKSRYEYQNEADDNLSVFEKIGIAVKNGTPLPKGHGDLIDANKIRFENSEFDTYGDYSRAFDAIDQAEVIIEADKGE